MEFATYLLILFTLFYKTQTTKMFTIFATELKRSASLSGSKKQFLKEVVGFVFVISRK